MRYLLTSPNTLVVQGPASLRVLEGEGSVLAAPITSGRKLVVRHEKQLPIEARENLDLEITVGEKGSITEIKGTTIPNSWANAAAALMEMHEGRALIVGATDVGKSTLCTYLTNRMLTAELKPTVIDADIGQADIGPPTTVTSATPATHVTSLTELSPASMIFIGHTSPGQVMGKLFDGIKRLVEGRSHSLTIINTDGWVLDPEAVIYKRELIDALDPELIIGISANSELDPILAVSRSLKIQASQIVLTRSRTDRRQLRTASFRRFLEGSTVITQPMDKLRVPRLTGLPPISHWQDKDLEDLIVGLLDQEGYLKQIGILLKREGRQLRIFSRPMANVHEIELGQIRLATDGTEIGFLEI